MGEMFENKRAFVLAGGKSSRMGEDKSQLLIGGRPMVELVATELARAGWNPTVLGGVPVAGYDHVADVSAFAGPLTALRLAPAVSGPCFVASCDLPRFRGEVAPVFESLLGNHEAVVPTIGGYRQTLCALYSPAAFAKLRQLSNLVRMQDWTATLDLVELDEPRLAELGIEPDWIKGINTKSEYQAAVEKQPDDVA